MSIRKKWSLLPLLALLVISIVGCTEKPTETSTKPKEESTSSTEKKKEEPKKEEQKKSEQGTAASEKEIKEMLKAHLDAFNKEDIDAYMNTMSQAPAVREQTKQFTQAMFDSLNVQAEFTDVKMESVTETSATLEIVQKSVNKEPNPNFLDNIVTATHFLVKEDGKWKFASSVPKKITDLNGTPIQKKP